MIIVKYFFEEPALLEAVTDNADPDARQRAQRSADTTAQPDPDTLRALLDPPTAYRGYLAGTDLEADRVGLTALPIMDAIAHALAEIFSHPHSLGIDPDGTLEADLDMHAVHRCWMQPKGERVMAVSAHPIDPTPLRTVAESGRRQASSALHDLLESGATVFSSEPAHNGFDWSFFSPTPVRDALAEALRTHVSTDTTRCFVLPYQNARSESKFYFEQWQLNQAPLPSYIQEV